SGTNVNVTWSSTNATSCTASGAVSGNTATAGSTTLNVISNSSATLTCTGPGGSASDSVTVNVSSTTPETNQTPVGWIDRVTNEAINGWAVDPDHSDEPIIIHLYFDGEAGVSTNFVELTTNFVREDVNQTYGITGSHGFSYSLPSNLTDGKIHTVYAYALDLDDKTGAANRLLNNSPQTFSIVPASTPVVDGNLILDKGTVYVVSFGAKRPFVSLAVFLELGYDQKNIRRQDISGVPLGDPILTSEIRHPRGAVVNDRGTVYFMGKDLRYPFPSAEIFLSWGHKFTDIVPANNWDRAVKIGPTVERKDNPAPSSGTASFVDIAGVFQGHTVEVWSVTNSRSGGPEYFLRALPNVGQAPYPVIVFNAPYHIVTAPPSTEAVDELWTSLANQSPYKDVSLPKEYEFLNCSSEVCDIFISGKGNLVQLNSFGDAEWALANGYAVAVTLSRHYAARDTVTVTYGVADVLEGLMSMSEIDSAKVGITGGSQGGHLSIHPLSLPDKPLRLAASVPEFAWVDPKVMYDYFITELPKVQPAQIYQNSKNFFIPFFNRLAAALGADTNSSAWTGVTKSSVASRFNTPVLLLCGTDDAMIPCNESVLFAETLRSQGKQANFYVYQNGSPRLDSTSVVEGAHGILDSNSAVKRHVLARLFFLQNMPPNGVAISIRSSRDFDLAGALSELAAAKDAYPQYTTNINELIEMFSSQIQN
ncbi:MAG: prolyl oligopeptidase family serine peptidase, partial [bacterium]|nr:prolyl oligopeptidase family serine peptidase [bacterium]